MAKSFVRVTAYPPGFSPDRVLTMRVKFSGLRYRDQPARLAHVADLLRRARQAPGVEEAGVSTNGDAHMLLTMEGAPDVPPDQRPQAVLSAASGGYAGAIGLRIVKGRWLTDAEASPAFVVNQTLARRYFGAEDPIGKRIRLPWLNESGYGAVVGVVADLRYANLDVRPEPEIFVDHGHSGLFSVTLAVRTAGDPAAAAPALRALLTEADRTQPPYDVQPLAETLADSVAPRRFNMLLLGAFAGSALLLATIGIYGVIAYAVAQRTHEIGVRMALGAQRRDVVRMIVWQGMAIAVAGIAIGIAAALALTRVLAGLLYDVTPTDPATFAAVTGLLAATAFAACAGPALKAALVDPIVALRCE